MYPGIPKINTRQGPVIARLAAGLVPLLAATTAIAGFPDTDGDGVTDNLDNCVLDANASQLDVNGDGLGNICDTDLNDDGLVNFGDLALLKAAFFPVNDPIADFNGDGFVNFGDLARLKATFFNSANPGPGPAGYANWVPDADGEWGNRNNWFPAVVPPPEAYVTIDVPSAITVTVDDNMAFAATALFSEERVVVDGTLSATGTIQVNDELVLAQGGRLEHATILPGTGAPLALAAFTTFDMDDITLATDLNLSNGAALNLFSGLTLQSVNLVLASTGSNTSLIAQGTMTVGGAGSILFGGTTTSDTTNRLFQNLANETLVVGSGITVESDTSGGRLGLSTGSRGLNVLGPVVSNLAARIVRIEGDVLSFDASAFATANGGGLRIDGNWENVAASTLSVTDGPLDLLGTWINNGTISVSNGTINIDGAWSNAGAINLVGTPFELDGNVVTAQIGTITSDDTVEITATIDNAGATLNLDSLPADLLFAAGARINGGTVGGSAPLVTKVFTTSNLDAVVLATDMEMANGSVVNLFNGLTLTGSEIALLSAGSNTSLVGQGAQTIGGTGEIRFDGTTSSNTTNRIYQNNANETLTLASGVTVTTGTSAGRIGLLSGTRGMAILGQVLSAVAGRQVRLEGTPLSFDADNLLASNGGGFYIDGAFTIAAGDTLAVNGGAVDLLGDWLNDGLITVANAPLSLDGTWDNDGTINISNALGEIDGDLATADLGTITSDDIVELLATVDNNGTTLNLDQLPAGLLFGGGGRINGGTITGSSTFSTGTFDAVNLDGVVLDSHFLLANGASLNLFNGLTLSDVTVTLASAGSNTSVVARGAQTIGGTGTVVFGGTTTADTPNRLYQNDAGQTLTLGTGISFQSGSSGGRLGLNSGTRGIDVQGSVTSNLSGRTVRLEGFPLSFAGDLLAAANGGGFRFDGDWVNDDVVTLSDSHLEFEGTWANTTGQFNVTNTPIELDGAVATADIGVIASDGEVLLTGTVENAGATLDLDALPAGLSFASGGRINNGTISGAAGLTAAAFANVNLDAVTLATELTLQNGAACNVFNGMAFATGKVSLESSGSSTTLLARGTQSFTGNGTIAYAGTTTSDTTNRVYQNDSGQTLTIEAGVSVTTETSAGRLGLASAIRGLTLLGSVTSDLPGRQVRLEGTVLSFDADNLSAANGGGFLFDGTYTIAAGDTLSVTDGDVDLLGNWSNAGTVSVTDGNLNLDGTWSNGGSITASNTPLELDGSVTTADLGTVTSDGAVSLTAAVDNNSAVLNTDLLPAGFTLGNTATINGGTISGSSDLTLEPFASVDLNSVTLEADVLVANGAILEIGSGLTLSGAAITLASTGSTTRMRANQGLTIGGTGELVFGGTTTNDTVNRIDLVPSGQELVVGPDVIVRSGTAGGYIGSSSTRGIRLQGQLIVDLVSRQVRLQGNPLSLEGSISIGPQSTVEVLASDLALAATAAFDVDLNAGGPGVLDAAQNVAFDGDLNLALLGGFVPAECDEFTIGSYATRTGTFAAVNGPDFGGGQTFAVFYDPTALRIRRPGAACP